MKLYLVNILLLLFLFIGMNRTAAQKANGGTNSSEITILQDPRIDKLIEKHASINESIKGLMPGFRVQLFFGSKKKAALEVKADFIGKHDDIKGYVIYDVPYFKVRVGDFRTHLEAQKLHEEITEEHPGAFIVKDMIPVPEMK